jgi:ATP-dependent DNA helicase RecG
MSKVFWQFLNGMKIDEQLSSPEGKTLEFKRDLSSPKPILKTLTAFANTAGGILLVGVADDRSVRGLPDPLGEEERLASWISDGITPRLVPDIEIISWRRKQLLAVRVYPSALRPHWVCSEGLPDGVYVRVGSTNRRADTALMEAMRRHVAGVSYDENPLPELNTEALDFRAASVLIGRMADLLTRGQVVVLGTGPRDPNRRYHSVKRGGFAANKSNGGGG